MRKVIDIPITSFQNSNTTFPDTINFGVPGLSGRFEIQYSETNKKGIKYSVRKDEDKIGFLVIKESREQFILKEIFLEKPEARVPENDISITNRGLGESIIKMFIQFAKESNIKEFVLADTSNYGLMRMVSSKIDPEAKYLITNKRDSRISKGVFREYDWLRNFGIIMLRIETPINTYGLFTLNDERVFVAEDDTFSELNLYPFLDEGKIEIKKFRKNEKSYSFTGLQVTIPEIKVDITISLD